MGDDDPDKTVGKGIEMTSFSLTFTEEEQAWGFYAVLSWRITL